MSEKTKTEMDVTQDIAKLPALGRRLMFLDKRSTVNRLVYVLYAACALLFVLDFLYKKKTYFEIEYVPGFYAVYGFFTCVALVVCAKAIRVFLKRDETYYAPKDVEGEDYPADQLEKVRHDT